MREKQPSIDPYNKMPMNPACIKVCSKEEYWKRVRGIKPPKPPLPHIGHGKIIYLVKAGILAGSLYWTVRQGVWGDQQDVTETMRRWQEYIRSINTRRPPAFDKCGNVILKEQDSIISPIYALYKSFVTNIFSGIYKFPVVIKCMYIDYLNELEKNRRDAKARR
ncbi:uncharacterized protein LOC113226565 isoform X2 [Hyposmocoma kahamanoa]|uniref:uncharacterized protein LOC113226565 isoform X2 n=1 Tax=Hyposmocoma kahamanoa TaxID=1477025 RepID=UPI000E6D60CA|nr:uncharacterized protein LOC113226565 isoform X2 [Hyposmocoma kahamanoa]